MIDEEVKKILDDQDYDDLLEYIQKKFEDCYDDLIRYETCDKHVALACKNAAMYVSMARESMKK